jgi:hypothetical protein
LEIQPQECIEPSDVDILNLLRCVKKHPEVDGRPGEYGIFTRCVMWAEENNVSWNISDIHTLAQHLEEGTEPEFERATRRALLQSVTEVEDDAMDETGADDEADNDPFDDAAVEDPEEVL